MPDFLPEINPTRQSNPLSIAGTSALRNALLSLNLAAYKPDGNPVPPSGDEPVGDRSISPLRQQPVIDVPELELVNEWFTDYAFLANQYGPEGGYNTVSFADTIRNRVGKRVTYPDFTPAAGGGTFGYRSSFNSIGGCYSPLKVLLGVSAEGLLTDEDLAVDSPIQQLGAIQLNKEFQARIGLETEQHTIGRINGLEALSDPYMAGLILTGKESLIERDNQITVPGGGLLGLVAKGLDFISRITGVYSPFSYIPGDYFNLEEKRHTTQAGKIISDITGILGELIGIPRRNQTGSDRFIEFMGGGQKSALFRSIRYNKYGPQYGDAAQANTAAGAVFGEIMDVVGAVSSFGLYPPNLPYYVGSRRNSPTDIVSPPASTYAGVNYVPVYGPSEIAKEFEGRDIAEGFKFGPAGTAVADNGFADGGFTWVSKKASLPGGTLVGRFGVFDEPTWDKTSVQPPHGWLASKSTTKKTKEGSVMDVTQQIVESQPDGGKKFEHVGHAIDQVSKVFNDGYKELTKGSRVIKYRTTESAYVASEYCRIFTKDIPYAKFENTQRAYGNIRKEIYSVLDKPYNLNIAPIRGDGSTNIDFKATEKNVKKYMFSIENLAWRTSSKPGFTVADLPVCERGPNGGRVMWFPPYDISFNETSNANWTTNQFLGRPEPIYTYNNTERIGSLSFKVLVDHPTILNVIARKEKERLKLDSQTVDRIIDSFFAGCTQYDIFELAQRHERFTMTEISTWIDILNGGSTEETIGTVIEEINEDDQLKVDEIPGLDLTEYVGLSFHFDNDYPDPNCPTSTPSCSTSTVPFQTVASTFYSPGNIQAFKDECPTSFVDPVTNVTRNAKEEIQAFFDYAKNDWEVRWPAFANKLKEALDTGHYKIIVKVQTSASSPATNTYNVTLSERRFDAIKQLFQTWEVAGQNAFQAHLNSGTLGLGATTMGEDETIVSYMGNVNCSTNLLPSFRIIYSPESSLCRRGMISVIEIEPIIPEPKVPDRRIIPPTKKREDFTLKNVRREIASRILDRFVDECSYFDLVEEETGMFYSSVQEKLKYFQPSFHSMTPEGLNSRLTFLNQCVRPGETIPTVTRTGDLDKIEKDADNTAFGAPPIVVLRIGDFYNTKIAIDNINITYDPLLFDLNPEGIGVQPMIASVQMAFKFIGGAGLKEPVQRLQNALSFNYYANTEVFDVRAEETVTNEIDNNIEFLEKIYAKYGGDNSDPEIVADSVANEQASGNQGGSPLGDVLDKEQTQSGETGTIQYNTLFNDLKAKGGAYMDTVINDIETILDNHNYGLLQLIFTDTTWYEGEYRFEPGLTVNQGLLVGKVIELQGRLESLYSEVEATIDGDLLHIQQQFIAEQSPNNNQKRKLRNLFLEKLEEQKTEISNDLLSLVDEITESQTDYTLLVDQFNIINNACDGYTNDGTTTMYTLSGGTPSAEANVPTAQEEMYKDYEYLFNVMQYFTNTLMGDEAIHTDTMSWAPEPFIKRGNYVSPSIFRVSPEPNVTNLNAFSSVKLEYLLFSNLLIDPSDIDSTKAEAVPKATGSLWSEIETVTENTGTYGWDISAWKLVYSQDFANNEYYFRQQFEGFKFIQQNYVTNGVMTEFIEDPMDPVTTISISDSKERTLNFATNATSDCEEDLLKINALKGGAPDESNNEFNYK